MLPSYQYSLSCPNTVESIFSYHRDVAAQRPSQTAAVDYASFKKNVILPIFSRSFTVFVDKLVLTTCDELSKNCFIQYMTDTAERDMF